FHPNTERVRSCRASTGAAWSATATRRGRLASSISTTRNISEPIFAPGAPPSASADSIDRSVDRDCSSASRLAACIVVFLLVLARAAGPVEVGEEAIDRPGLPDVVGQLFTHQLLREIDGLLADVAPQFVDDLLPLGLQLLIPGGDDPVALRLGLGLHVGDDLLPLRPGVLSDLSRLGTRLGELGPVLVEL